MENLFLAQVVRELTAALSPGPAGPRVERVSGLAPAAILIQLAGSDKPRELPSTERERPWPEHTLVVCLDPALPCLAAIDRPLPAAPAAKNPDGFIKTLSDILRGAVLTRIEQHGRDRAARVVFTRGADGQELVVWVELFGRRPVAVLAEGATGVILASSHEGVRSASGGILHSGATYRPPLQKNKTAVEELTPESLRAWTEEESEDELSLRLSRRIEGLSPNAAQEIIHGAGGVSGVSAENLLEELRRQLTHPEQHFTPAVRASAGTEPPLDGSAPRDRFNLALFPFGGAAFVRDPRYTVERFDAALEAVRHCLVQLCLWYRGAASRRLRSDAAAVGAKLKKLRVAMEEDMAAAERSDRFSRAGELILTHMREIPRGADTVQLMDVHGEGKETVEVKLDPALSASENADRYFKKARKAKRAREVLLKRTATLEHRLRGVEKFVSEVPDEVGPNDLARLRQRLEALGGAGGRTVQAGHRGPAGRDREREAAARVRPAACRGASGSRGAAAAGRALFNPRVFATSEGYTVIVGRNNNENDYVTHRLAKPEDLWFHAYGVTGSHVILRHRGKAAPSRRAIEEAASMAAYFSKAKTSSAAPVIYTQKKFVNKPRGARPGTATCAREKMVMAKPVRPKAPETESPGTDSRGRA